MAKIDNYGCNVTLDDAAALQSWNACMHGFLSHAASTGDDLGKTLLHAPDFALAQACKGIFSLLLGRRELDEVIAACLAAARTSDAENPVSQRERFYIDALEAWIGGNPSGAIDRMERVLERWPHDPIAMKISHAIRFMLGDLKGMRTSLENVLHVYGGHPAEGYLDGCYAFALEETGDYEFAERRGRMAIEKARDDAWGLHAITHVFDMTGRAKAGLEWIEGKESGWQHCNNFRYHVWWHIALMHLDLGEYERVLELYDEQIRKDKTDDYRDISNATSVLLRLEFENIDIGNRWEELAELSSNRVQDNCVAFADLHYMMALSSHGQTRTRAEELMSSMSSAAEKRHHCEFSSIINSPGHVAAMGLEAYREHDFELAYRCFASARPNLQEIGGSHAQRDIFERLGIEAALRAGLTGEARDLLHQRDQHRGHQDNYSLNRWTALDSVLGTGNTVSLGAA